MGLESIATDGFLHFTSGVVVSFLDYGTTRLTGSSEERINNKKECIMSIEKILDGTGFKANSEDTQNEDAQETEEIVNKNNVTTPETLQYAMNVETVKDYLNSSGKVKFNQPIYKRILNFFPNLIKHEKINNLSWRKKLLFATGFEVIYDSIFGFNYYTNIVGESPIAALSRNMYQIPLFAFGLLTGNGAKKVVGWFATPKEERMLDKTINKLLRETPILDVVVTYKTPENVQKELKNKGLKVYSSRLTGTGKSAVKGLLNFAGKSEELAGYFSKYKKKKEESYLKSKEERKKIFDEITKNR